MTQLARRMFVGEEGATTVDFALLIALVLIASRYTSMVSEKFLSISNSLNGY